MPQNQKKHILVVGAGFAGAVYSRVLAEAGYLVSVIDARDHIGGNAYDYVNEYGIRVHKYGPHLFHTKNTHVVDWLRRFGSFLPYEHKVRAKLSDGRLVPLPINRSTINAVFNENLSTAEDVEAFLQKVSQKIIQPKNAGEYLNSRIGVDLTDLFFRPYTKKMWLMDLEELSPTIVKRIPLNYDDTDTYFNRDEMQLMPSSGYEALFTSIFDHENIDVNLNTAFDKSMQNSYFYTFNSMPIDVYYECDLGELPYRSIRFHHRTVEREAAQDWPVINFTDDNPYTRETAWHALPRHVVKETGRRSLTIEEPCDYKDNAYERYYPVKTADGRFQAIYDRYRERAQSEPNLKFIGRCGTYQYLDMDQVINQSLAGAREWLSRQ